MPIRALGVIPIIKKVKEVLIQAINFIRDLNVTEAFIENVVKPTMSVIATDIVLITTLAYTLYLYTKPVIDQAVLGATPPTPQIIATDTTATYSITAQSLSRLTVTELYTPVTPPTPSEVWTTEYLNVETRIT